MANIKTTQYVSQDPREVSQLVQALESQTKKHTGGKKSFTVKKSTFTTDSPNGITVDSWRFHDWDYKRDDLPTSARGLFTSRDSNGNHVIVTRGYDKFFNTE